MSKISFDSIDRTMVKAASIIRAQNAEIERLQEALSARTRHDHAEKIASAAVERGWMDADDAREYAFELAKSEKDLDVVEDVVNRTAAGTPLSTGIKKIASDNGSVDVLTSFLLTNDLP